MNRLSRVSVPAGVLLLAACTATPAPVPPSSLPAAGAPTAATAPSPSPSATVAPGPASTALQRGCASLVSVGLGDDAWRTAPVAGPAAFGALDYRWGDRAGFAERAPDAQGWRRFKVAMRLRGGTPATVSVAGPQRAVGALTYLNGLDHTVDFAACGAPAEPPTSEFAGGFALREAVCLPVDVTSGGATTRVVLDFGKDGC
ncbi:hypothetical protein [Dactylosporangium siamense]|uniref:Secreted protein n=1 Tax=Dactylosporangium siamense TaxID=685454 RepID=A0A919UHC8_9ACTN|nr:hypothetical protein [Dactylosporangium siamense]GIG50563.1 hypothetical protein Dsi01nite_086040 [Dactylosporangium siamense]